MKAALVKERNVMAVEDIAIPEINDNTMLVKVVVCAICGSDIRIYSKADPRAKYPIVIGHEIAGVIEKLGKNVTGFKEGDRVCVAPGHGCGECIYCKGGHSNVCITPCPPIGYASNGGFAEYMSPPVNVVKNGYVNKIPENISFEEASMSELLACCINAQENAKIEPGDTVLIMGAGPAGCMHIQLSKLNGASKVFVTQRSEERLNMAKRFNPDKLIASSRENLHEIIMDETNGLGVNVIYVCAPSVKAQEEGFKLLAPRGQINFFGGLPKDDCQITIDANHLHYTELFITGASSSLARGNKHALELISEGKINAKKYISHTFPLDEIEQGFRVVQERRGIKVIIKP